MPNTSTQSDYIANDLNYTNSSDDEARWILNQRIARTEYRDLDLKFTRNPNTGDLGIQSGSNAVKRAIKNLILTDYNERLFKPGIGCGIKNILFNEVSIFSEKLIEDYIRSAIENFEPRAELLNVEAKVRQDELGYDVKIVFAVRNEREPVTFTTFLESTRG